MSNYMIKHFNNALHKLELSAKGKEPFHEVERLFGYLSGIAAAMEVIYHPLCHDARFVINEPLMAHRTRRYWRELVFPKKLDDC